MWRARWCDPDYTAELPCPLPQNFAAHGERDAVPALGSLWRCPTASSRGAQNGWLPLDQAETDWKINSIGWISACNGTT